MEAEIARILSVLKTGVRRVIASCVPADAVKFAPPPEAGRHVHPMREILFQLQGETCYMLAGKWYCVRPGDAVFIDEMEEHGLYFLPGEHDLKQLWIGLYPKRLNLVFISLGQPGEIAHSLFYSSGGNLLHQILKNNWDAARNSELPDEAWRKKTLAASLELLFCDVARAVESEKTVPPQKKQENIIDFLDDYIDGNHGNDCALDKLEKLTGYSRYYLSHLYREYHGKTIGEAINEARMRFVVSQNRQISSKEIAETLGFTSAAIFWKWRKKHKELEQRLK